MPNCVAADIPLTSIPANHIGMTTSEQTVFEGPLQQLARSAWQLLLLIGVLAVALGVIVLAWPGKTLFVAGVLFGIYLVVSGIGYMFAAFGTHTGAAMRVLTFLTGVVSLVLGFFCFRDKFESILLLALWIGISWVFRGMTLLAAALSFDHLPGRGWQVLSGVIIVIGGGGADHLPDRFDRGPDPGRRLLADRHRHRGRHHRVPGSPPGEAVTESRRARLRQSPLDLERQAQLGEILWPRE